jgi:hypothetical protein
MAGAVAQAAAEDAAGVTWPSWRRRLAAAGANRAGCSYAARPKPSTQTSAPVAALIVFPLKLTTNIGIRISTSHTAALDGVVRLHLDTSTSHAGLPGIIGRGGRVARWSTLDEYSERSTGSSQGEDLRQ